MPDGRTVSSQWLASILRIVAEAGVDVRRLGAPLHLGPEARLPAEIALRFWELAPKWCSDDDFGLHVAEKMPVGAFGVVEYIARSAPNVGEALRRILRVYRLVSDVSEIHFEAAGGEARIVHELVAHAQRRHAAECLLATFVLFGRELTGAAFVPRQVAFAHPAPASTREHARIFRAPILFEQPANVLVLDATDLALPIVTADNNLLPILERHAAEMVARLPLADDFVGRVRLSIAGALTGGVPSLDEVASALAMSPRALQRKLKQRGTSLAETVDDVRRGLALRYVADPSLTIMEVALLLGFSGVRAFHRAFKRWTGATPGEHRRSASERPPAP